MSYPPAEPTASSGLEDTKAFLDYLANEKESISARQLISYWGSKTRGTNVVSTVESDLEAMGLYTDPPFDTGLLDNHIRVKHSESRIEESIQKDSPREHLLTLARIPSATFAITTSHDAYQSGYVTHDMSASEASSLMLRHDFSQVPVVHNADDKTLEGVFSWKTLAHARLRGEDPEAVTDAIEPADSVDLYSDLFTNLQPIADRGFVIVTHRGKLSGIVTAADLTHEFENLAIPFLTVGRCEQELKRVAEAKFASKPPKMPFSEMMFGNLQDYFRTHWDELDWDISKTVFNDWLTETRTLRNSIAHFDNPDADVSAEVASANRLTEWLRQIEPETAMKNPDDPAAKEVD